MKLRFSNLLSYFRKPGFLISCSIYIVFGAIMFSIPFFSFKTNFNIITWILTFLFLSLTLVDLFLTKAFKIDIIVCSYLLFMISIIISSALSLFKNFSPSILLNTAFIIVTYIYGKANLSKINNLLLSAFIGITIFAGVYLFEYRSEILSFDFTRLGELFGDINDIGIILCLGFAIGFSRVIISKKWYLKVVFLFLSLLIAFLSFTSGSKICILLITLISFSTIIIFFGKKYWYLSLIFIALFICAIFIIINIPAFSSLKHRLDEMLYTLFGIGTPTATSVSSINRIDMIKGGFSLFLRRPLFGYGINGYESFAGYPGTWSHNHVSETFANFGVFGTILYHFPLVYGAYKLKGTGRNYHAYIFYVFVVVSMISTVLFREKFFTYMIGFVLSFSNIKDIRQINTRVFLKRFLIKIKGDKKIDQGS